MQNKISYLEFMVMFWIKFVPHFFEFRMKFVDNMQSHTLLILTYINHTYIDRILKQSRNNILFISFSKFRLTGRTIIINLFIFGLQPDINFSVKKAQSCCTLKNNTRNSYWQ